MAEHILIFCKAPVAGEAKTRLIPAIGAEAAAELHRTLARERIESCVELSKHRDVELSLWCSPDTTHDFYQTFDVPLYQQVGNDLGERMANGYSTINEPALLIGTDCPTLDVAYLQLALDKLKDHDAVIGPAEDGGYGLIGLQTPVDVFSGITWSTDTVCAETCRHFIRHDLNFALLPLLWDVDRPKDLKRYQAL